MRFLVRRVAWLLVTVWAVITVSFFLMRAVRGGPFDTERAMAPALRRNIEARYHLDWSLPCQYLQYLGPFNLDEYGFRWLGGNGSRPWGGALVGDLGPSFRFRDHTVNDVIRQSLPVSLALGSAALLWALALGVSAGIVAGTRPGSWLDVGLRTAATLGIAMPNFLIAGLLIWVFAFQVRALPAAGWGTPSQLILPALALGAPYAAYVARLTRAGLLEVNGQDYIRTAHAKGLKPLTVVVRHGLPTAMLPVISYLGPATAGILSGSLVIEKVFGICGTGQHFVNSALNRDYTLAMGVTILYTVLVYGLNTLVDILYLLLDPRIDLERN